MPVLERNVEPRVDAEARIDRREERTRPPRSVLTCDHCGFTHEAGDGTWTRHDPTDPLWVYECPECDHVVQISAPVQFG